MRGWRHDSLHAKCPDVTISDANEVIEQAEVTKNPENIDTREEAWTSMREGTVVEREHRGERRAERPGRAEAMGEESRETQAE